MKAKRIACPCGHHVPRDFRVTESGLVRCPKWNGATECGAWLYLFAIRGGGIVVAQVELAEVDRLEQLHTPGEIIDFLGIWDTWAAAA